VGALLGSPIVIEVTDESGTPVRGAVVEFAFTSAGDGTEIVPETATTDQDGLAEARILLGSEPGLQTGEARVVLASSDRPSVVFTAMAESLPPSADDNQRPTAEFRWQCTNLTCSFTNSSSDGDGTLVGWIWRFGDGTTSAERQPSHTYSAAGSYIVRLTVTDDGGATDELSATVNVSTAPSPTPNEAPNADFAAGCNNLACSFTDRSRDDDGTLVSWQWDFGDGATSSARDPSHSYGAAGSYRVRLTVRDNDGAQDVATRDVEVSAPAPPPPPTNEQPDADFDAHCKKLECTFEDRSKDDDGTIVAWQWDFGDGGTSSQRNPTHTYSEHGRYDVVLTVRDNGGATDTRTRRVDVKK
jgi:PKD repeat protein